MFCTKLEGKPFVHAHFAEIKTKQIISVTGIVECLIQSAIRNSLVNEYQVSVKGDAAVRQAGTKTLPVSSQFLSAPQTVAETCVRRLRRKTGFNVVFVLRRVFVNGTCFVSRCNCREYAEEC